MKNVSIALTLAIGFIFSNCAGKKTLSVDPKINNNPFQLIEGNLLGFNKTTVKGSVKYIYSNQNKSATNRFTFSFKLPQKDSSVKLIANSDRNLNNGVSLTFKRNGDTLKVQLSLGKNNYNLDSSFALTNLNASSDTLSFAIDVHDEDPTHILIWQQNPDNHYHNHSALYNSQEKALCEKINGKYWGFELNKAHLIDPKAAVIKHHHHH